MEGSEHLVEAIERLEARSRLLDTQAPELSEWLRALERFSAEFLVANAAGPAFHDPGPGHPSPTPLPQEPASFDRVLAEHRDRVTTRSLVGAEGPGRLAAIPTPSWVSPRVRERS